MRILATKLPADRHELRLEPALDALHLSLPAFRQGGEGPHQHLHRQRQQHDGDAPAADQPMPAGEQASQPEAEQSEPAPEPRKQHPVEHGIDGSQAAWLDGPGIEEETQGRVRGGRDAEARPIRCGGGYLDHHIGRGAQHQGPEAVAYAHPLPAGDCRGAGRGHLAGSGYPHHLHPVVHAGEPRQRLRSEGRAALEKQAGAGRHLQRRIERVAVGGEDVALDQAHAPERIARAERDHVTLALRIVLHIPQCPRGRRVAGDVPEQPPVARPDAEHRHAWTARCRAGLDTAHPCLRQSAARTQTELLPRARGGGGPGAAAACEHGDHRQGSRRPHR